MLTTLLESKSRHARDRRGATLSVIVHAALILGAVYATASGAPATQPREQLSKIYFPPSRPKVEPQRSPPRALPKTNERPFVPTISVPIEIPTSIPKIDVNTAPVTSRDFVVSRGASSAGDTGSTAVESGRRAYQDFEVESPVAAIGVISPEYPSALRSSGIEGHVTAQFIVNERGRFEESSLEILASTNPMFVESIRRALPRMRFRPAMIGDRAVPQLVRQEFSFVLSR